MKEVKESQPKKPKTEVSSYDHPKSSAPRLPEEPARAAKASPKTVEKAKILKKKFCESNGGFSSSPLHADEDWHGKDSRAVGERMFEWIIHPVSAQEFYRSFSEQQPLYLPRHPDSVAEARRKVAAAGSLGTANLVRFLDAGDSFSRKEACAYFSEVFTQKDVEQLLSRPNHDVVYRRDIDITRYQNGKRETVTPPAEARAHWSQVAQFIAEGCSLRFLCPQRYVRSVWRLLHFLDDYWGTGAGANTYLTPAGMQGFAPHFDEVDIFVLQTEGAKRWRLYNSRSEEEVLPEHSSRNLSQQEIGQPFLDVVLRPGDSLYAPRGTIHQCVSLANAASMHVTVSLNLRSSWGNLIRTALNQACTAAFRGNLSLRMSLPRHFHEYMGVMHKPSEDCLAGSDGNPPANEDKRRVSFRRRLKKLLGIVVDSLDVDDAADVLALDFMHGRVPPALSSTEEKAVRAGTRQVIKPTTKFRMVRRGAARLLPSSEKEELVELYHVCENDRLYKGKELACLTFSLEYAEALEMMITTYPEAITVSSLPVQLPPASDVEEETFNQDELHDELMQMRISLVEILLKNNIIVLSQYM